MIRYLLACLLCLLPLTMQAQTQNVSRILYKVDARTIASNGGGTPATLTLTPTRDVVSITCNDPDGCTLTMGEPVFLAGTANALTIVNITANVVTLADSSGVVELTSAVSLAQWESLSLEYVTDSSRWVERARGSRTIGVDTLTVGATGVLSASGGTALFRNDTNAPAFSFLGLGDQGTAEIGTGNLTGTKSLSLFIDGELAVYPQAFGGDALLGLDSAPWGTVYTKMLSSDTGAVVIPPIAVGGLPTCNGSTEGARASVNDSNATSFTLGIGAVVANGGTTHVPVYCDGTNWRIG